GPGSPTTSPGPRAPEHARSQAGGSHEKATGNATRRIVYPSLSGRSTSPEQNRTEDPVAHHPWVAPGPHAAWAHGTGVRLGRSTLSDPDGPRQTSQVAAAASAVHPGGRDAQEALCAHVGKGPDIS